MLSILLPTDFSDNAMNAIRYALEFFKHQQTEFTFLHCYQNEFYDHDDLVSREVYDEVLATVKLQAEIHMENLMMEVKSISPNPRFTYTAHTSNTTLVEAANTVANSRNIDLIVMGTKGKSDNRNVVFGSNTFQVLKYVLCPVLAIPSNYTDTRPKHILFATDYLIPYKRRELKLLSDLVSSYRSIIDVIYVTKNEHLSIKQEDNQLFIKETLYKNEVNFHVLNDKKVADCIERYIEEHSIDWLVMVNTQHSFLEDMLFPSTLDKVSLNLKIPLLAMQNISR